MSTTPNDCVVPSSSNEASNSPSDSSIKKWRSLAEIYDETDKCQLAHMEEHIRFEEAVQYQE